MKQFFKITILVFFSILMYTLKPVELSYNAWTLLIIFLVTIISVMLQITSLALASLSGLVIAVVTNTIDFKTGFSSFGEPIVWLILSAFFVSFGVIKSGLSTRLAFYLLDKFGTSNIGITYAICSIELLLGLIIPSATARTGGIIYPIISEIGKNSSKNFNQYITYVLFIASCLSSTTFLTAMAGNALIIKFSESFNTNISWFTWFLGAIVPTTICIIMLPFVLKYILGKNDSDFSIIKLDKEKKPFTFIEVKTLFVIAVLLLGWSFGSFINVSPAIVALIGVILLVSFNIVTWDELKKLDSAWDSFIWFSALLTMATNLNNLGVTNWIGVEISSLLVNLTPALSILILVLSYFYLHYFFASSTAHISALLLPFAIAMIKFNVSPLIAFLSLGYLSNLCACLTHYGNGPAPILFASKVLTIREWWKKGFLVSIFFLITWFGIALPWWKIISFI